eukprot:TRINITY_DN9369_c1_g1_i1.p1 TRINITY_DN9369_c1_g1~~TRINITY_DN9369_c1_g1_i1.p1  ORF type:complete len:1391 (+),score=379.95 TRINITY_DN9369_c1_g1_i1:242-4174(+)
MTHRAGLASAWGHADTAPSPRTPRGHGSSGTEFRLGIVVAELQRQLADERRNVHRQLEQLDRRLQEQLAAPAVGRERWADLQGSVSGMMDEMSAMARRVEGLDEKIRLKIGGAEDTIRQRTREIEQQVHGLQQKAFLSVSTSEEISKRTTAKLRKLGQSFEDQERRLRALEEGAKRPQDTFSMPQRLESRLAELEGQQASLEEEFRSLAASTAAAQVGFGSSAQGRESLQGSHTGTALLASSGGIDVDGYESIRALEREIASLAGRTSTQLDEHSAALANLRVRTEGQEQRLAATGDRLESVVSPPLEALRVEMQQLRDHDRTELESRLAHLSRQVKSVSESSEEAVAELKEQVAQVLGDFGTGRSEEPLDIKRLAQATAMQEQQLRRLEATLYAEPQRGNAQAMSEEEFCSLLVRVEGLEQRVDCVEETGNSGEVLSQKADRADLLRLDAAMRELSDPLRRLSQRSASNESRSAALERRLEQVQDILNGRGLALTGGSGSAADMHKSGESSALATARGRNGGKPDIAEGDFASSAGLDAVAKEVAEISARLMEMESVMEGGSFVGGGPESSAFREALEEALERVARNEEAMSSVEAQLRRLREHVQDQLQEQPRTPERGVGATAKMQALGAELAAEQDRLSSVAQELQIVTARLSSTESATQAVQHDLASLKQAQHEQSAAVKKADSGAELWDEVRESMEELASDLRKGLLEEQKGRQKLQSEFQLLQAQTKAAPQADNTTTSSGNSEEVLKKVADCAEQVSSLRKDLAALDSSVEEALARLEVGESATTAVKQELLAMSSAKAGAADTEVVASVVDKIEELKDSTEDSLRAVKASIAEEKQKLEAYENSGKRMTEELRKDLKDFEQELEKLGDKIKDDSVLKALERDISVEKAARVALAERFEEIAEKADAAAASASAPAALGAMDTAGLEEKVADALEKAIEAQDLSKRLSSQFEDLNQRVEASEATSKAFREEVMCSGVQESDLAAVKDSAKQGLELARTCGNDIRSLRSELEENQAALKGCSAQVEKFGVQLTDLEKAQSQRSVAGPELALGQVKQADQGGKMELETKVEDLRKQVAEELEQLIEHQKLVAHAGSSSLPGSKVDTQDLESSVQALAGQVAFELRELREHQGELKKVRPRDMDGEVESKIADLQKQALDELDALRSQQAELAKAKATVAGLSEKFQNSLKDIGECQETTASLSVRLLKLEASKENTCPQCGNVYMSDAIFCRSCGRKRADNSSTVKEKNQEPSLATLTAATSSSDKQPTRGITMDMSSFKVPPAADSDDGESYGNDDFDESAEELT